MGVSGAASAFTGEVVEHPLPTQATAERLACSYGIMQPAQQATATPVPAPPKVSGIHKLGSPKMRCVPSQPSEPWSFPCLFSDRFS